MNFSASDSIAVLFTGRAKLWPSSGATMYSTGNPRSRKEIISRLAMKRSFPAPLDRRPRFTTRFIATFEEPGPKRRTSWKLCAGVHTLGPTLVSIITTWYRAVFPAIAHSAVEH
jgi:hypothetical protein